MLVSLGMGKCAAAYPMENAAKAFGELPYRWFTLSGFGIDFCEFYLIRNCFSVLYPELISIVVAASTTQMSAKRTARRSSATLTVMRTEISSYSL
jgi:hypothetical protein